FSVHAISLNSMPSFVLPLLVLTSASIAAVLFLFAYRDRRVFYLGGALLLSACAFSNTFAPPPAVKFFATSVRPEVFSAYFFWMFAKRFPTVRTFSMERAGDAYVRASVILGAILFLVFMAAAVLPENNSLAPTVQSMQKLAQNEGWMALLVL